MGSKWTSFSDEKREWNASKRVRWLKWRWAKWGICPKVQSQKPSGLVIQSRIWENPNSCHFPRNFPFLVRVRAYHGVSKSCSCTKKDSRRLLINSPWNAQFAYVLASTHQWKPHTAFVKGKIAAIVKWYKKCADAAFHYKLRRASWEVVVPELVFESW